MRHLKGHEIQSVRYRTAVPLIGLFAGIAGALLWLAVTAGTGSIRSGLIVIAGLFTAVAALLLARAVFARRFLNAYHGITELWRMDPFEFERYIANLFRRLGYGQSHGQVRLGSMQIHGVPHGFFVATTRFSPPAVKLAAGRGIELIDDAQLALLVRKVFPPE